MVRRVILAGLLIFVAGGACAARAQDGAGEEKLRDIRRLLELNGTAQAGMQAFDLLMPNMRAVFGAIFDSLPPARRALAVRIMEEETRRAFTAERMVEELVPIYERYLTAEDIKALIVFYESPAGRKLVAVQPQLIRESGVVGDKIAEEAIERIYSRYRDEKINLPGRRPPRRRL
ncbi:MAG: DUF2059 domain-containing protein [Acidobacteria bacterium]|nr:DUF2059 domain-containing protein [Acidobacteriota bacterium]